MESGSTINLNGIAVIGMSCRFPKAKTPEAFWQNLCNGTGCLTEFSKEDLRAAGIEPSIMSHPSYVNKGIVLEDVELFDASFFGFSPRDAEIIDPQHRIFLECAWEALENAGYEPEVYNGLIGVYGGVDSSSYLFNIFLNPEVMQSAGMFTISLHNDKDSLTTRVSYKLNLKGPALTVQTSGSSSLVAIIQACQGLLNYQCDIALAGGSAINLPQKTGYFYQPGGMASPDGYCRAFDAKSNGTVMGSGAGIIVLKRLEEAINDGDHIDAVIRGFGIGNNGSTVPEDNVPGSISLSGPYINGQAQAIAAAYKMADVDVESITYIEAHGTGNSLEDSIEISGLTRAFRQSSTKTGFCGIGSVKTNIGYCSSASGVAGIIKTILSLKHQVLAPTLHFTNPNPDIDFANSPFYVVDKLMDWHTPTTPRRAGVSSFGTGGTNAHVILEEAPPLDVSGPSRKWQLLMLSAKTPGALDSLTANLSDHLTTKSNDSLADIAYTLQVGRRRFAHRKIFLLPDEDTATAGDLLRVDSKSNNGRDDRKSIVFMFTGQGSQYINMGFSLYEQEPLFKDLVDYCCGQLIELLGVDLRKIMYTEDPSASEQLKQTSLAQPALFVIEYALAKLWMSWGVKPKAMIGHSIGELVAACIAGVFSLEDALRLVASRGKLMQSMAPGAMVVVHQPRNDTLPLLDDTLSIAAVNTPSSCVVSGPFDSIESLEKRLGEKVIPYQRLNTSHAFHSGMMDGIVDLFTKRVEAINLQSPQIPFFSNITGKWMDNESARDPAYWGKQIRAAVQFSDCMVELLKNPEYTYLEVGPGNSLCTLLYQHRSKLEGEIAFPSLPHPKDKQSDEKIIIQTLGELWLAGVEVDWPGYYRHEKRQRVALPTYPFERERYWIDPSKTGTEKSSLRKPDINQWLYIPSWKLTTRESTGHDNIGSKNGAPKNGSIHLVNPANEVDNNLNTIDKPWLVFTNEHEASVIIIEKLKQQNRKLYSVLQKDAFTEIDEYTFGINPAKTDDYFLLLQRLSSKGVEPEVIIHLWNVTDNSLLNSEHQTNSFTSLLYLAQALTKNNIACPIQLKVVSNHLYQLNKMETIESGKAMLVGACKVIPQEFVNITCQNIDISGGPFPGNLSERMIEQVLAEFAGKSSDVIVAFRNEKRWAQSYKPVNMSAGMSNKSMFRKEGVYLITGGLGGIGLALAKYLGKRYKAKLVLTGRSFFPHEEGWEDWLLTHSAEDGVSQKIRQFMQLRQLGAEFMVIGADVTSLEQMEQLCVQIQNRFGGLHGVIHSAGVAGGGLIAIKKEEQANKVIDPKVRGTLNLENIFGNKGLDFFVLCSSLSAIVGGVGQIDYCAANNFMDAFAHEKNSHFGTRYISINWDTWGEVGMAVNTEVPEELKYGQQEALRNGIRNEEGVELFERILAGNYPQVLVSTSELLPRIERLAARQLILPQNGKIQETRKTAVTHVRPRMSVEFEAATTPTETKLTETWIELLGIEKIGINDNFLELGGHSLLAIQLTSRLRSIFNVEFSIQSFFESPTIKTVAAMIDIQQQNNGIRKETDKPSITKLSREKYRVQNISQET